MYAYTFCFKYMFYTYHRHYTINHFQTLLTNKRHTIGHSSTISRQLLLPDLPIEWKTASLLIIKIIYADPAYKSDQGVQINV